MKIIVLLIILGLVAAIVTWTQPLGQPSNYGWALRIVTLLMPSVPLIIVIIAKLMGLLYTTHEKD